MKLEKMRPDQFRPKPKPMVTFNQNGCITFNKTASERLELVKGDHVSIYFDKEHASDYFVKKESIGWKLRQGKHERLLFNCRMLSAQVIEQTWLCHSRAVDATPPKSSCFFVAPLPLDDKKHDNLYALLRKNA